VSTDLAQQAPTEPAQAPADQAVQAPTDLSQPAAKPAIGGGTVPVGPKLEIAKPKVGNVAEPLKPNLGGTGAVGQAVEGPSQVIAPMHSQLASVPGAAALPPTLGAHLVPDVTRSFSAPLPSAPAVSIPHSQDLAAGETATALQTASPTTTAVVSLAFNSLPLGAFGHATTGQPPQHPDPGPTGPAKGPGSSSDGVGPSNGLAFSGLAALLLALMAFAAPALGRRIRISPACWRPVAFVSLLERPG